MHAEAAALAMHAGLHDWLCWLFSKDAVPLACCEAAEHLSRCKVRLVRTRRQVQDDCTLATQCC